MSTFYTLTAASRKGPYEFSQLKGKVVLVVNTARFYQFKGLEALHQQYKDRGVQLIGFPCNQFGGQDPKSDEEIGEFCSLNYGVTFPMMNKSDVNGDKTNEVYQWLKSQKKQLGMTRIKWNFEKFLVNQNGDVVQRYSSMTKPEDIAKDIEPLLSQK